MHLSPARRSPLDSARQKKRAASPLRFLPPHRLRSFYDLAQFLAVKGSLSDHLCVATCRFFTFPSSICPNKLHRQRCVFFSSRLFLPRFRIRQPLDYRRGRIEGHPPIHPLVLIFFQSPLCKNKASFSIRGSSFSIRGSSLRVLFRFIVPILPQCAKG